MRDRLALALKNAIVLQDKCRMSTLRLINAAIKDRDIAARGLGKEKVNEDEILQILGKMVKQRLESSRMYDQAGRSDLLQQECEEMDIISSFLPRQLSEDEVKEACRLSVDETHSASLRDMGRCIGWLKLHYPGQMDFARASRMVKDILSG
ncbi:MAG: GatB/YqeY domain-containing protein [Alphaproteobacteria bacterium]|nr:GatB/YqeY domain-containing protein [Alphaproteobacteria bacterium]